jgi:hypothetical protein
MPFIGVNNNCERANELVDDILQGVAKVETTWLYDLGGSTRARKSNSLNIPNVMGNKFWMEP